MCPHSTHLQVGDWERIFLQRCLFGGQSIKELDQDEYQRHEDNRKNSNVQHAVFAHLTPLLAL
jgi:hypothetical protein